MSPLTIAVIVPMNIKGTNAAPKAQELIDPFDISL
jgi:hypothetical protein